MKTPRPWRLSRRRLLATAAGVGAGLALPRAARGARGPGQVAQAGIATAPLPHLFFSAFDVGSADERALRDLVAGWSVFAASHTGEVTVTIGLGPTLFDHRFGLESKRPTPLTHLPAFPGDRLDPTHSGGDVALQVCAYTATAASEAANELRALGAGVVTERWSQRGFRRPVDGSIRMTRNLLGFEEGAGNIPTDDWRLMDRYVWAERPAWFRGGSCLVVRRIHLRLHKWEQTMVRDQERAIGRRKRDGARLDPAPAHAHVRLASAAMNGGVRILRRGYSFDEGWKRTGERDAGLFFVSFQRDPRQFVRLQSSLAMRHDALRDYLVHTSSAVFACPPVGAGGVVGAGLWS